MDTPLLDVMAIATPLWSQDENSGTWQSIHPTLQLTVGILPHLSIVPLLAPLGPRGLGPPPCLIMSFSRDHYSKRAPSQYHTGDLSTEPSHTILEVYVGHSGSGCHSRAISEGHNFQNCNCCKRPKIECGPGGQGLYQLSLGLPHPLETT